MRRPSSSRWPWEAVKGEQTTSRKNQAIERSKGESVKGESGLFNHEAIEDRALRLRFLSTIQSGDTKGFFKKAFL